MNKLLLLALCAIALGGFAGCNGDSTADGGTDSGPHVDAGHDGGTPPADMFVPPTDMFVPPADMFVPPVDMGPTDGGPGVYDFRTDATSVYVRFDRMGMPAVATALVSASMRGAYNGGSPSDDIAGTFAGDLIANLTGLHAALDDDITGAGLTPCSMTPAPACLTQHVGGATGPTVQSLAIPDVIHVDTTGTAGFPNGRKLTDPVIDVTLSIILLDIASTTGCGGTGCTPTTLVGVLNPTANDVPFDTAFPYLAAPHPAP